MDPLYISCREMGTHRSSGKLEVIIIKNAKDEMDN
jgi:hypothetical protein